MPQLSRTSELDDRLVRYLAVSVVTLVCLIHWHSSRAGLFLNKLVAWYKTILLLVIFIAGMVYSGKKNNSQWNDSGDRGTTDGMAGMVLIFYSYQGWENANYVGFRKEVNLALEAYNVCRLLARFVLSKAEHRSAHSTLAPFSVSSQSGLYM